MNTPRIALVYDRANTKYGGAEHVLTALHQIFPEAPLFTSVYDPEQAEWAASFKVFSSIVQKLPFAKNNHRHYVGIMPLAFEAFNLDAYDIVISVTSAEAKGVLTKPHQLHLCYLLTPTRYLWSHPDDYKQSWPIELLKKPIFRYLKWWDEAAALRPDIYLPISERVADRCKTYYRRDTSEVIYPPISVSDNDLDPEPLPELLKTHGIEAGKYYLVVARLVGYKKVDLAVKAAAELRRPLVIIGDGPEYRNYVKRIAEYIPQPKIVLIRSVHSSGLAAYYKNCLAFLAPGEEDFGIAALEANAYGKPSILNHKSGAAEISPDKVASVHLQHVTLEDLKQAMLFTEKHAWKPRIIRSVVTTYDTKHFQERFLKYLNKTWLTFSTQKTNRRKDIYGR